MFTVKTTNKSSIQNVQAYGTRLVIKQWLQRPWMTSLQRSCWSLADGIHIMSWLECEIEIPVAELNTISSKFGMTAITEREHQFISEDCTAMKPLTVALDILLSTVETLIFKTLELRSGLQT